jgi:hypothetical protein
MSADSYVECVEFDVPRGATCDRCGTELPMSQLDEYRQGLPAWMDPFLVCRDTESCARGLISY